MKQNDLAKRMKSYYQDAYNIRLPKRTNVVIRLDGKGFGQYTKGLERPFDEDFAHDMDATAKYLMANIQGCKLAYVQSDEISLVLTDYDTFKTSAWFDNKLQKIVSVSASMATREFNKQRLVRGLRESLAQSFIKISADTYADTFRYAEFDSRAFIIPFNEEVVNYFIWRQQDATRNSISMAGQAHFSHNDLQNKTTSEVQDMLMGLYNDDGPFIKEPVNWNDYPIRFKRGGTVVKRSVTLHRGEGTVNRTMVEIENPPIFSKDRNYILNKIKPTDG